MIKKERVLYYIPSYLVRQLKRYSDSKDLALSIVVTRSLKYYLRGKLKKRGDK